MTAGRSDLIDLSLGQFAETEQAFGVYNAKGDEVWLPKSQVERDDGSRQGSCYTYTLPKWLAVQKEIL
jgi:hypothetical protein